MFGKCGQEKPTPARNLGEEIEDPVPGTGERERPGVAATQAQRGGGKLDAVEGNVVRLATNEAGKLCAEPGGRGNAVAGETRGKIHAFDFSSVRHDIESEIERAAPDEFYFSVVQLGINADHTAAENFGALAYGVLGFREERGAASEEHAIVRREAVVVEKVFGVVDHAVPRAEFASEIGRQNLRGDDVRANGNDFFSQRGSGFAGVGTAGEDDFARGDGAL